MYRKEENRVSAPVFLGGRLMGSSSIFSEAVTHRTTNSALGDIA